MFTGLTEAVGRIAAVERCDTGARLLVDPQGWTHRPAPGDSIAVSGCCLTFAPADGDPDGTLAFDVVHETLRKTKLGALDAGDRVNLEACLTPATRIGGHFVLGHVDAVATVAVIDTDAGEHAVAVEVPAELVPYLTPTGSVAVDGVSLTLARVDADARRFTVALIPTTLAATTLGDLAVGAAVNIETDVLAKTVVHALRMGRT